MKASFVTLGLTTLTSVYAQDGDRIVGGQPVTAGRYPWQAGLIYTPYSTVYPACGGTLIAPNVVLSAGHCFGYDNFITVGCNDLTVSEATCERFTPTGKFRHPSYISSPVPQHDFTIYTLPQNSNNKPIDFVFDGSSEIPSGRDLTTIGWGDVIEDGANSNVLLEVDVDYVANPTCASNYAPIGWPIDSTMLCAARGGKDACQGDSGGPIIVKCDTTGEDILVGDTSFGLGCARAGYPGVYGRVSSVFDWINDHVVAAGNPPLAASPDLDQFCTIGGTFAPTAPTPQPTAPPTFPPGWTCSLSWYTDSWCDCNCGAYDPTCDDASAPLYGCASGQVCNENNQCEAARVAVAKEAEKPVLKADKVLAAEEVKSFNVVYVIVGAAMGVVVAIAGVAGYKMYNKQAKTEVSEQV